MWAAGSRQVSNPRLPGVVRTQRGAPMASPGGSMPDEQPGQHLEQDLGLRVAAHGAEHRPQRPIGSGDQRRRQRVRRSPAGAVLGGMSGLQREADAPVVQQDPGARHGHVATEPGGVRLDEADAAPLAVHRAQIDRPAIAVRTAQIGHAIRTELRRRRGEPIVADQPWSLGAIREHGRRDRRRPSGPTRRAGAPTRHPRPAADRVPRPARRWLPRRG